MGKEIRALFKCDKCGEELECAPGVVSLPDGWIHFKGVMETGNGMAVLEEVLDNYFCCMDCLISYID